MSLKPITDEQYRRQFNRLYAQSARAGSKEECDALDRKLATLNARREATKAGRI